MKQDFKTEELKQALEAALGFTLRELVRLDGASALNFRAVRDSDGLTFAVKCSPKSRQVMFDHLVRHLEETKGTKAVTRLFAGTCPPEFRGYNVICLSWCAGVRLFPDQLTSEQLRAFLDDYQEFSAAIQRSTTVNPPDPIEKWRKIALANCRGISGRILRAFIERELPEDEVRYRRDRLSVIHGDFHHGNFLFVDGRVAGFFDLEEFCGGTPADDIVRYFVCAAEHLKWYEQRRKGRILRRFAEAVAYLPYSAEDWRTAIDGLLVRKIFAKTCERPAGVIQDLNLLYRARFYLALRRLVA